MAQAADPEWEPRSKITFPVGGETFYMSDIVNVTFETPIVAPYIMTWCNRASDDLGIEVAREYLPPGQKWMRARMDFRPETPLKRCWFNLQATEKEPNQVNNTANSYGWSVNRVRRAETTVGLGSPTSTAQDGGSSSATSGVPVATTITEGAASQSLSAGAIAGISIGVALLAAVVGAFGVIHYWHRRRKAAARESEEHQDENRYMVDEKDKRSPPLRLPHEMSGGNDEPEGVKFSRHSELPDPREYRRHELAA